MGTGDSDKLSTTYSYFSRTRALGFWRWFVASCKLILWWTALIKILSLLFPAVSAAHRDPVLGLNNWQLWVLAVAIELGALSILQFSRKPATQAGTLVLLSTGFVLYRIFLTITPGKSTCACLGYLGEWLGLSADASNVLAIILLTYMLIGSYVAVFYFARE